MIMSFFKLLKNQSAEKLQIECWKFLTQNKLKEIFEYCSEGELNIIRLKSLDLPTFNLGVSLRKTEVN